VAEHNPVVREDALREIVRRLVVAEERILSITRGGGLGVDRGNTSEIPAPFEGQVMIEAADDTFRYFSNGAWRSAGSGGGGGGGGTLELFPVKVYGETVTLTTGTGKAIIMVPAEFDGWHLSSVEAFVSTVSSSGKPTIMLKNLATGLNMLSVALTIDVGEKNSYEALTPHVVNGANAVVATGQLLSIDITTAGTGAKGLGVNVYLEAP